MQVQMHPREETLHAHFLDHSFNPTGRGRHIREILTHPLCTPETLKRLEDGTRLVHIAHDMGWLGGLARVTCMNICTLQGEQWT